MNSGPSGDTETSLNTRWLNIAIIPEPVLAELDAELVEPVDPIDEPVVVIEAPVVVIDAPVEALVDEVVELDVPPAPPAEPPSSHATAVRRERTAKDPRSSEVRRMRVSYTRAGRAGRPAPYGAILKVK